MVHAAPRVPLVQLVHPVPMVHVVKMVNPVSEVFQASAAILALWAVGQSQSTGNHKLLVLKCYFTSQTGNIPNCPRNSVKLWSGFSLSAHQIGNTLIPTDLGQSFFYRILGDFCF